MVTNPKASSCSPSGRSLLLFIPFLILSVLLASDTPAQPAAGKKPKAHPSYALIFGTVWGPDDRPVYGVKVKIRRTQDKKAKWELFSDHSGEFAQRVPAGKTDYVVGADLKDLKAANGKPLRLLQEVAVHVDNDERVDISLHLTQ